MRPMTRKQVSKDTEIAAYHLPWWPLFVLLWSSEPDDSLTFFSVRRRTHEFTCYLTRVSIRPA